MKMKNEKKERKGNKKEEEKEKENTRGKKKRGSKCRYTRGIVSIPPKEIPRASRPSKTVPGFRVLLFSRSEALASA